MRTAYLLPGSGEDLAGVLEFHQQHLDVHLVPGNCLQHLHLRFTLAYSKTPDKQDRSKLNWIAEPEHFRKL